MDICKYINVSNSQAESASVFALSQKDTPYCIAVFQQPDFASPHTQYFGID